MLIKDVMTKNPVCCRPSDTADVVAKKMLDHDCGEIPVCDGTKLIGVITDRDITCRVIATDRAPRLSTAREIMTGNVCTVHDLDDVNVALDLMEQKLVRRLPVVNDRGVIVGILSQADLIARTPTLKVARSMKIVSQRTRRHEAVVH